MIVEEQSIDDRNIFDIFDQAISVLISIDLEVYKRSSLCNTKFGRYNIR